MAVILTFPHSSPKRTPTRAAFDAADLSLQQEAEAAGEMARMMEQHRAAQLQLEAFNRQCEAVFAAASRTGGEILPFRLDRPAGEA